MQDKNQIRQWANTVLYPLVISRTRFGPSDGWPGSVNSGDWGIYCALAIDHL